jgi:exo-beta-1,3-glucanase (GH17 family)
MMHNDHLPQHGNMGQYSHMAYSEPSEHDYDGAQGPYRQGMQSHDSYGSEAGLAAYAGTPGSATPRRTEAPFAQYQDYSSPSPSRHLNPNQYHDQSVPTSRSHEQMATAAYINPNEILDDGDDFPMQPKRASRVNMAFNKSKSSVNTSTTAGAGLGAGAIGDDMAGGFNRDPSGNYSSIPANRLGAIGEEKSAWMKENTKDGRKKKKILFILAGIIIIAGIIAGTVAGVMSQNRGSDSSSSSQAQSAADDAKKGDLGKDSDEIKKLLNNPDMHKVFSGFAYTPLHAQYPDCLTAPPIQNNVTRDMALLGQLTNVVRMYGTDCNQTEMVLHAIDRLELNDMKIWLGVWLGNNDTTNTRQVDQMWKILDTYGTDHIKGVIVGNEVLFRQDLTATQLGTYIAETKTNLTSKGYDLPVATADLGDNWTAALATQVDVVMANIHPFFGGVTVENAAAWSYSFWQDHDVVLTQGMTGKSHIISEFGWPSEGGNKCGQVECTSDTQGSVASIPNMNYLMDSWVCEALTNGTDYFW